MESNLAYQEETREELIDGKVVLMSPRPTVNHNFIAGNIFHIFRGYLKGRGCVPFGDGTDLYLTEKDRFVPDGMIVCDRDKIKTDGVHGAPDLVIEVLSPSTARQDRGYKKDVYEASGIPEYWLVNPADRSVEVHRLHNGRYIMDNLYTLYPDFMLKRMTEEEKNAIATEFKCHLYDDLVIRLDDIFSDLL